MNSDPMLPLAAAVNATSSISLGSAVVLAFARSPMVVAQQAWALADASRGRFTLGLGTQVKPHITRRFSMPWSAPAPRMREYIAALRHIWEVFQHNGPLAFRGEHYTHNLMHPLFNPGPIEWPDIPIALTGVGPAMTRLAGELASGYMAHAFTNTSYQDQVTIPALRAGLEASARSRADIWTFGYAFLAVGDTEEDQAELAERIRGQIAFYASTPMYREVLEAIGYGDVQPELERLIKAGRAADMPGLVDDAMLEHFYVRGTFEELPARIQAKYGGYFDRFASYYPLKDPDLDRLRQFTAAF
jgi:probable F420-dependent oxidoreductase